MLFFHLSALNKRRQNKITHIMDLDQNWISNPALIENALVTHLTTTYTSNQDDNNNRLTTLSNSNFPTLIPENMQKLFEIPNEEEIKNATFSINPLKTSREDGLHAIFYQTNWKIIKDKLITEIQFFLEITLYLPLRKKLFFA